MIFGAKQNQDFWHMIFKAGKAPNEVRVLADGLDLQRMIQPKVVST